MIPARNPLVLAATLGLATLGGCAASVQVDCEAPVCDALCRNSGYVRGFCDRGACHCTYDPGMNSNYNPWDVPDGGDECGGCPVRSLCCDGVCRTIETDPTNCGVCGRRCLEGEECVNGWCTCGGFGGCLEESELCCDGACVSKMYDPTNCGACGHVCQAVTGPECFEGECVCPDLSDSPRACAGVRGDMCCERTFLAAGGCFDLDNDREHCGTCDLSCPFFEGSICLFGQCQDVNGE